MIKRLCMILVNDGTDYLEDKDGNVLVNTLSTGVTYIFKAEVLHFNTQEDSDSLVNVITITNPETTLVYSGSSPRSLINVE